MDRSCVHTRLRHTLAVHPREYSIVGTGLLSLRLTMLAGFTRNLWQVSVIIHQHEKHHCLRPFIWSFVGAAAFFIQRAFGCSDSFVYSPSYNYLVSTLARPCPIVMLRRDSGMVSRFFSWLIESDKVEVIDLDLYLMVTIDQIDCDQYNTTLWRSFSLSVNIPCARCRWVKILVLSA